MTIFLVLVIWVIAILFVGCNGNDNGNKTGIQAELDGKYISVFGDSISTYAGVSDSVMQNNTLPQNKTHYFGNNDGVESESETWWGKLINDLQVNLLVNNSSSGAKVYGKGNVSLSEIDQGIGDRANNLHANRGKLKGKNPDIILIFIGINDFNEGTPSGDLQNINFSSLVTEKNGEYEYNAPSNFAEGYFIMSHKIINNYKNAKVFMINLPNRVEEVPPRLVEYNNAIKGVAEYFNATLVDLYSSKISGGDYINYTKSDNLHPDKTGMAEIASTVQCAIEKAYLG